MSMRNVMLSSCVILGSVLPCIAQADIDIDVTTAPPALKEEPIPAARSGYVWSRGYWKWEDGRHIWVTGHWVEERPNAHWVPDQWTQDPERPSHWHFKPGHWES